ncbi:SEC-C metal-binding domain-containing protein [Paenibacillus fonticola]|uniref:SEC-C metal-binding domain-containing protein n=1 Tax=Paenibacillus fonticola TaxID=379896 RepID=UPI00039B2B3A|nr:SEC-C metal-binding domain-containing protein [Paenibacillus fonticola]
MQKLGQRLRKELYARNLQLYFNGKAPGHKEPCACGSSKKYKACCAITSST